MEDTGTSSSEEEEPPVYSYSSKEMLSMVEQNNSSFKVLCIGERGCQFPGMTGYSSNIISDYPRLGIAIGNNTNLDMIEIDIHNHELLEGVVEAEGSTFYDSLERNSSITELSLHSDNDMNDMNEVGRKILKTYQKNNSLATLFIQSVTLRHAIDISTITNTLTMSANLMVFSLIDCNINDMQLRPIVDALLGHPLLRSLSLDDNQITNVGCQTISELLQDPNSNLEDICLRSNDIRNDGAISFVNSLTNNNMFRELYLFDNEVDISIEDAFSKALCDTSSINSTFDSNHTFIMLCLEDDNDWRNHRELYGDHLHSLLTMNECTNKKHVAMKKILQYHPNLDMAALFELDL